jgi:hypothetical protein
VDGGGVRKRSGPLQEVNDVLVLNALDRLSDFRLFAEEIRSSGSALGGESQ